MRRFVNIKTYDHELSKYVLQARSMSKAERIFHHSKRLKNCVNSEVGRSEPPNLQRGMIIADRVESLFPGGHIIFG